ncbi:restriction endonuclease subunit S [Escherichia coli]|uniref:restriction endonuclease subunit S n=2 Tax=Escherichia coli TaxID=562 RepID=UPI000DE0DCC7|nr:restriction endonuclease subunit S [Escherichia coli]
MMKISEMPKYEVYKDSGVEWIGKIPEHWNLKSLKRVVKEHSGNGFPIELQGQAGDIPFLKVSDLSCEGILVDKSSNRVSHKVVQKQKWNIVPAGSLVTAKIGEALRKNHRKLLAYDSIIDNNCIAFECVKIEKKYNFYLHLVIDFDWFVNPGAVPSISVSKYKSQKVVVPSMKEQVLIANFLDKKTALIDEAISIKEQQISLLKERKQIIIQQAVTQGLDPNVPMKDSGVDWIGKIPAHWDLVKLGSCLSPVSVKNSPELPLLSITREQGVIERDVDDQESNHNFIPDDLSGYKKLEKGQFGMNKMKAWQGSYGVSKFTGIVSPAYFVFDFTKAINPEFFNWAIRSKLYVSFFGSASDGVRIGQWDLSKARMKVIPFVLPSEEEQLLIAKHLDEKLEQVDVAIKIKLQQIERLREYRSSLINSAVTGKIKITPEMVEQ